MSDSQIELKVVIDDHQAAAAKAASVPRYIEPATDIGNLVVSAAENQAAAIASKAAAAAAAAFIGPNLPPVRLDLGGQPITQNVVDVSGPTPPRQHPPGTEFGIPNTFTGDRSKTAGLSATELELADLKKVTQSDQAKPNDWSLRGATFDIRTMDQAEQVEKLSHEWERYIKSLQAAGKDTKAAQMELDGMTHSLESDNVMLLRQVDLLEKAAAAQRALGTEKGKQRAAALEHRVAGLKSQLKPSHDEGDDPGLFHKLVEKGHELERVYKNAGGGLMGFAETLSKVGMGTIALAANIFGLAEAGKASVEAFIEFEQVSAKLDAALASQGLLTDEYREKLHHLSEEMMKASGVAKEQWMNAFSRLTQFGADDSNIRSYAKAVQDLAGILGGDVEAAANMFSRAMQGSFTMFSRLGIHVKEAGTQVEKMDILMHELSIRGGQQLEARLHTIAGSWQNFKNAVSENAVAIGSWLSHSTAVQTVLNGMAKVYFATAEAIGTLIPKVEGLKNQEASHANTLDAATNAMKNYKAAMDAAKVAANEFQAAIRRVQEAQQIYHSEEDKLEESNQRRERERLALAVEKKRVTPVEEAVRKSQLEEREIRRKGNQELTKLQEQMERETTKYRISDQNVTELETKLAELKKKEDKAVGPHKLELEKERKDLVEKIKQARADRNIAGQDYAAALNNIEQEQLTTREKIKIDLAAHKHKADREREAATKAYAKETEDLFKQGKRSPYQGRGIEREVGPAPPQPELRKPFDVPTNLPKTDIYWNPDESTPTMWKQGKQRFYMPPPEPPLEPKPAAKHPPALPEPGHLTPYQQIANALHSMMPVQFPAHYSGFEHGGKKAEEAAEAAKKAAETLEHGFDSVHRSMERQTNAVMNLQRKLDELDSRTQNAHR